MTKRNHLSHRSVLSLTGKDRITFLQGLITNDLTSLNDGDVCWSALLNVQGRIQNLFFVFALPDTLLIDTPAIHAETMHKQLKRFRLRADVTIDITSFQIMTGAPQEAPPSNALCCTTDPRHPLLGWRAVVEEAPPHTDDDDAFRQRRLSLGIPEMDDMAGPGQTLALEANMDALHGVSWEKGCYLGQEVTARMHYRAHAKRRLLPVTFEGPAPAEGSAILLNGQPVGELRAAHGPHGLAMIHRSAWNEDTLTSAEQTAHLVWPQWLPTSLKPEKG